MNKKKRYLVSTLTDDGRVTTVMTDGYQSDNGIPDEEKQDEPLDDWTIPEEYYE